MESRLAPANNPLLVAPALSSLPTASASIYLDFTGCTEAFISPAIADIDPYDLDGNPNAFSALEQANIQTIWRYVAEDFVPFNINVTTVQPSSFAPLVGMRVAVGGDGAAFGGGLLGIAPLGTWASNPTYRTAFAFAEAHAPTALKDLAFTISHEGGHLLGLRHQSQYSGTTLINVYSPGPGDGTSPLMGGNSTPARDMWWNGPTTTSTTIQNDLTVLSSAANGFGLRPDDHGSTIATATNMATGPTAPFTRTGVLETMADNDYFRINANAGPLTIAVNVPAPYNNLDVMAQLLSATGAVLVTSNPTTSFNANITFTVPSTTTYYLLVTNAGRSSGSTTTNYGINVGSYTVVATYTPGTTVPPTPPPTPTPPAPVAVRVYAPLRWTYDYRTKLYSGYVTFSNPSATPINVTSLTIYVPDASVQVVAPGATRSGNAITIPYAATLSANNPVRLFIQLTNPRNLALGSFFTGFLNRK